MDDFAVDILLMALPVVVILAAVYAPTIKGRITAAKRREQELIECRRRIAALTTEAAERERCIDDLREEVCAQMKLTRRLRADLQKRTDQYNDLVDLAREKGIIGE